ncbi:TadE/TadG family type IV pilus assembly protein [Methylobacterium sp. J-068]|uniref:TadE/TadG family type IV pilus assembly protein n=1 Tax=Methylobacterium sp. J-068 TaxID=2836649 RepID=UPI001FB8D8D4|nr:TadE/TadG family type IV pilus assembly protein [Methylobacterium sp. J-068]MCJ2033188.1 pilus assembly protein TadG-related protein [Methylobacterium sp. J-068]
MFGQLIAGRAYGTLTAMQTLTRLRRCEDGNILIMFALLLPVIFGIGGAVVDYGNAIRIRSVEATVADATALLVANADTTAAAAEAFNLANAQLTSTLGTQSETGGFKITGNWLDGSNYRVTVSMIMKTAFIHILPGMPNQIEISTAATVNRVAPVYETSAPSLAQLSPEAADYNRVYMYCYSSDPKRQKDADAGRRGLTPIADNASPPSSYDTSKMPVCGQNEAVSYMLRNVRDARTTPSRWNEIGSNAYNYYTDLVIDTGTRVQTMNMKGNNVGTNATIDVVKYPMLETIICDSLKDCSPKSSGGIIPDRKTGRSPNVAKASCEEGKYMYYGWEDRPGGDQDYDDIRLIVSCPKQVKVVDKKIRIVE